VATAKATRPSRNLGAFQRAAEQANDRDFLNVLAEYFIRKSRDSHGAAVVARATKRASSHRELAGLQLKIGWRLAEIARTAHDTRTAPEHA
jgi:hypothetical protein